jgi:hypothetical protein
VSEQQTPESGRPRTGRTLTSVGVVLAVAALAVALFVVVRSFRNVKPEPLPPSLKTAPPDTALVIFRASYRKKTLNLAARCRLTRERLQHNLTPSQDSLGRECDSAIAVLLADVTALDSVRRENRKAAADSFRAEYGRAKAKVNAFTRSSLGAGQVSEDSLNKELKKLISE